MQFSDSTVRIRVIGEELRRHRTANGWSLVQAAKRVGIDHTKLSRMETGQYNQKCEEVAGLLAIYGVQGEERKQLLELSRSADRPGLWVRHSSSLAQRVATLQILESQAIQMINFECEVIPGLLQTVPYARALLRNGGQIDDEDQLGDLVAARIHRQAVLRKVDAPELLAVISENALHNIVDDETVMHEQLVYLTEVAKRPNVTIRIIPRSARNHPGLDGPFLRMRFRDRQGVIMLSNRTSSLFLEDDEDLLRYSQVLVELLSVALDNDQSVALLGDLATHLA